ncbi:MAG: hypothetical protein V9G19_25665 [Tetrasphaera sp.]
MPRGIGEDRPVRELPHHLCPEGEVPLDRAATIDARKVDMPRDRPVAALEPLEQHANGQGIGTREHGILRPAALGARNAQEGGPERRLGRKCVRWDVETDLVGQLRHTGADLPRLTVPPGQAEDKPTRRAHDDDRALRVAMDLAGAQRGCATGSGIDILDIDVEMHAASGVHGLQLDPWLPLRRKNCRELIALASRRRQLPPADPTPELPDRPRGLDRIDEQPDPLDIHGTILAQVS